jgi:hypothetical protein
VSLNGVIYPEVMSVQRKELFVMNVSDDVMQFSFSLFRVAILPFIFLH